MEQLQLRYGEEGLAVIAINLDTDSSKAREFLVDQPSFEVLLDPEGSTPEAYGVSAVPSSYIIDRHGKIAWVHRGFRSKDAHRLEERIGKLLRN